MRPARRHRSSAYQRYPVYIAATFSVFVNGESRCISVASKVLDVDSRLLALSKPACRARNRPHRELECRQSPDLTLAKKTHSN